MGRHCPCHAHGTEREMVEYRLGNCWGHLHDQDAPKSGPPQGLDDHVFWRGRKDGSVEFDMSWSLSVPP